MASSSVFKVYIVDDDPLFGRRLSTRLGEESYDVESFTSAAEAANASLDAPPDAVIAGYKLGAQSGMALLKQLRSADPHLAGLIVTSIDDDETTAEARRQVGPLHQTFKPFDLSDLLPKLKAALHVRQLACKLDDASNALRVRDRDLRASRMQVERTSAELETTHTELATATERLMQAEQLAAVGRVVSGIAHEVERQLTLVGYAEAIKTRVTDDPEIAEFADIIVNAQKRLSAMVDEIRDFASTASTGDRADLHREPADLAAIVADALAIMHYDTDVRKRRLDSDYRARPLVSLHREKFAQVVMNLVSNAVLATESGDTISVEVDVDDAGEESLATVVVRDTGVGMSRAVLSQLGEPFFTTRGGRGSGLGVGICMRIVEEHGGALTFESSEGKGTTARVTLPVLHVAPAGGDA